jgi:hypothetical protein
MAYKNNIPQPTDFLSVSQADLLNNFSALQTLIDINHVDFASSDQGKHKWVTFPVQGSAPSFLAGEEGIYNLNNVATTKNELYVHKQTGATTAEIPFTASTLSTNSAPASGAGAWTYLPSGILLISGDGNCNGTTTVTISIPVTINALLSVLVCPFSTTAGDVNIAVRLIQILSATTFSVYGSSRTSTGAASGSFQWLAIGY